MSEAMKPGELEALAGALRALAPAPAALDRDRLMYEAGRASLRQGRWAWPALAAAGLLLATALGTLLAVRPPAERVVYVQVEKPPEEARPTPAVAPLPDERAAQATYWQLHMFVLEHGVDELPPPPPVPPAPRQNGDDL